MKPSKQGAGLGLLFVLVSVVGCGEEPPPLADRDQSASEVTSPASQTPTKAAGVIPQHQLDALRKAGGVEAQLRDSEAKRRAQLEALGN